MDFNRIFLNRIILHHDLFGSQEVSDQGNLFQDQHEQIADQEHTQTVQEAGRHAVFDESVEDLQRLETVWRHQDEFVDQVDSECAGSHGKQESGYCEVCAKAPGQCFDQYKDTDGIDQHKALVECGRAVGCIWRGVNHIIVGQKGG